MKGIRNLFHLLNPTDRIVFLYLLLTTLWILAGFGKVDHPLGLLCFRLLIFLLIGLIVWMDKRFPGKIISFIWSMYPLLLLAYFYDETDSMNNVLGANHDALVAGMEEKIFGYQPCFMFSRTFPQEWFSHLMFFSYFSYFLLLIGVIVYQYFFFPERFPRSVFMLMSCFFFFCLVYILLPVAGPPHYFRWPINEVHGKDLFERIVMLIQDIGERPTGAFPSSHVGLTLISLYFVWQTSRKGFMVVLPMGILIILSTVYIKAHYAVDVIAGILYAPFTYLISTQIYRWFTLSECELPDEKRNEVG
jgi:membrane-associated phospholipid phosphatase